MTVPSFDFVNPQKAPEPQLSDTLPDFSFVGGMREGRGLFSKIGHTLDNIRTAMQAELALGIDPGVVNRVSPERKARIQQVMGYINEARAQEPESVAIAIHDIQNFFSKMTTEGLSKKIGEVFDAVKSDPKGALMGIPAGIAQMGMAPLEMGAGVSLTEEDIRPLTPIERASRIKETAAIAVSTGIGLGARVATRSALGISRATVLSRPGRMGRNALTGLAEGSVGGSVYGAIANANEEDQLAEILINGVIFAPLGAAIEAIGGEISYSRQKRKELRDMTWKPDVDPSASFIQNTRKVQFDENQTLGQVAEAVDALATEDDIAVAAVRVKMVEGNTWGTIVAGVKDRAALYKFAGEHGFDVISHGNDVLVLRPDTMSEDVIKIFRATGHFPGEFVFYNGKEYQIRSVSNYNVTMTDIASGDVVVSDINLLRRSSEDTIDVNVLRAVEELTGGEPLTPLEKLISQSPNVKPSFVLYNDFMKFVFESELGTPTPEGYRPGSMLENTSLVTQVISWWDGLTVTGRKKAFERAGFDPASASDLEIEADYRDSPLKRGIDLAWNTLERRRGGAFPNLEAALNDEYMASIPHKSFDEHVHNFAKARNLDRNTVAQEVKRHIFEESLKDLDEVEQDIFRTLRRTMSDQDILDLSVEGVAITNGMIAMEIEPDVWQIIDAESDKVLHTAKGVAEAKKWINATGQAKGIDLDGGGSNGVPPDIGAPFASAPNPDNPWSTPYVFARGKMEEIVSAFNSRITWFTPFMNIFTALDSKFGTQVFSRVFNATQDKASIASNANVAGVRRIKAVEDIAKGISSSRREIIGGYLNAMTPDEVIKLGDLNPQEVSWAKRIADSGVNVDKLFKYHKQVERATRDYPKDLNQRGARLNHSAEKLGMTPKDLEWYNNIFNKIPATGATIGPTVRLARAYSVNGDSRAAYSARHKMTGQELRVAHELEKLHNEFAKEFGVDDFRKFNFFMAHARLHTHGVVADALKYFDKVPPDIKKFIETMQRTGELNPYEKDPIFALQRFVTAGNDARYLDGAVKTAKQALEEEILKVPDAAREGFRQLGDRYLADLRGIPPAASRMTQAVIDQTSRDLKLDLALDVKRHIADAIITSISSSIQGFRIKYGIMDFTTTTSVYFSRNGSKRTKNMWTYGKNGVDGITREALKEKGIIRDLSPIFLADLAEYGAETRTTRKGGQLYNKAVEVGFQVTGQKQIYEIAQAGTYLETWKHTGERLRKLSRGEIDKARAYKEMGIDTYELAAGKHFDDLVSASKFEEAADFLGKQAIRELIGVYQMANAPYGWNTNTGRLLGQFGRYPAWIGAYTRRLASRGTRRQRAQNLMRFAAANSVIAGAGVAMGVNLFNWMPLTGMLFTGGPASDMAMTAIEAVSGYGGEKELAQSRLRQYLLYDPFAERWNVGQPYLPGSYFINDLVKASQAEDGLEMLTRALGLSQLDR